MPSRIPRHSNRHRTNTVSRHDPASRYSSVSTLEVAKKVAMGAGVLLVTVGGIYLSFCDVTDHSWCVRKSNSVVFANLSLLRTFFPA